MTPIQHPTGNCGKQLLLLPGLQILLLILVKEIFAHNAISRELPTRFLMSLNLMQFIPFHQPVLDRIMARKAQPLPEQHITWWGPDIITARTWVLKTPALPAIWHQRWVIIQAVIPSMFIQ